jgi:hypothetical protein
MPEERLGEKTAVRMAGRSTGGVVGDRMGQEGSLRYELSDILYNSRKYRPYRGVSRLEVVRDDRVAPVTGTFGGGDLYLRERA